MAICNNHFSAEIVCVRPSSATTDRPLHAEAAEYYFKYIDLVPEGPLDALLDEQLREALALLQPVTEERSRRRYQEDKWSLKQVLAHLCDAERVFAFRAFWFARGFTSELPSFDEGQSSAGAQADARSWAEHLDEFKSVRSATLTLVRGLPEGAWERQGTASAKAFSVRALAYIVAGHTTHHLALVRERYL